MPNHKTKTLHTVKDVERVCNYIADVRITYESHQEYLVTASHSRGAAAFAGTIGAAVESVNRTAKQGASTTTLAHWLIARFPDQTWLTVREQQVYGERMIAGLSPDLNRWAWHVNRLTGAADFNLVIPRVILEPIPRLRRWLGQSLRTTAMRLGDLTLEELNDARKNEGKLPIGGIHSAQNGESAKLVSAVADAAVQAGCNLSLSTLPALLQRAGFTEREWRVRDHLLVFRGHGSDRFHTTEIDRLIVEARALIPSTKNKPGNDLSRSVSYGASAPKAEAPSPPKV